MTVKLQKQIAYRYKDKTHHKYVIIMPENIVSELGWKEGQELSLNVKDSNLLIEKGK
jgi:hypothetical protein